MAGLPKIRLGRSDILVSRLISGGNPLCGNSHFSNKMSVEMQEYFTSERVVAYLHSLQAAGINTLQARGDYHRVLHWLELFRREGGQLHWIAQTASEMSDVFQNIRILAAAGAVGVYHHGTETDRLWLEGRIDQVCDYLKCMRDAGVQVGLGTHIPEVIEYAEDSGWDIDFYMACFYNINRKPRSLSENRVVGPRASGFVTGKDGEAGDIAVYRRCSRTPTSRKTSRSKPDRVLRQAPRESALVSPKAPVLQEEFLPDDPPRMCAVIRQTEKTCLAFKILGASRLCATQDEVVAAFRFAFSNIKPKDAVVVGMFPKDLDQIALNVQYTRAACGCEASDKTNAGAGK